MKTEFDIGMNPNMCTARDAHPDFKEELVFYTEIEKYPYRCPRCRRGNLRVWSTLQRCCIEDWEDGRLRLLDADPEEVQHFEIIACLNCEIRFIIQYELDFPRRGNVASPHDVSVDSASPEP